ncbi:MAG: hypothetical protein H6797_00955 [Candidatus Nomurabacteria bacterium]|nr:MAG: hypothetical protein H6797_00955 [Candidatus Nomurabacteria bacterium]
MQPIKTQVSDLLNKQMDRQDFLKHVGIGLIAITGLSSALRFLSIQQHKVEGGYGSAAYGGSEDGNSSRL